MTIAGCTGHQRLGSAADVDWVRHEIKRTVAEHNVHMGLTSLAVGADQLFATVLVERNIAFTAVIPCRRYEEAFDQAAIKNYRKLLQMATATDVLDFDHPTELAYYEAGKTIVERAGFMIAVWNSKPAKGLGGTADIVAYAKEERKSIVHINTDSRKGKLL